MTDLPKKKIKMVAKDPSGGLVQAMPKTKAEYVSCGDGSLDKAIDALPPKDVVEMQTELEPHSTIKTIEYHNDHEGTMTKSPGGIGDTLQVSFSIAFSGTNGNESSSEFIVAQSIHDNNDLWLGYFYDKTNTQLCQSSKYFNNGVLSVPSNTPCYYNFEIPSGFVADELDAGISGCVFYDEDGNIEPYGDSLFIKGAHTDDLSGYEELGYEYASWLGIRFSLPPEGSSTTLYFNTWMDFSKGIYADSNIIEKEKRNKSLTIEHVSGTRYRLCFLWSTAEHKSTTTTTNWKELKTTVELNDGTKKTIVKPISGILQKVDASTAYSVASSGNVTYPERNGLFEASLIIGDDSDASETNAELLTEIHSNMWPFRDYSDGTRRPARGHWYEKSIGI